MEQLTNIFDGLSIGTDHTTRHTTEQKVASPNEVLFLDMFCGIGSFHKGFIKNNDEKYTFVCGGACDINENARNSYHANYGIEPLCDICDIEPKELITPEIRAKYKAIIFCSGFPCQPFSNIGHRLGFDDERGQLFFQITKFSDLVDIMILENVSALLSHDGGATFTRMAQELNDKGFSIYYKILKCSDYGIPQMRKRLFIVCVKEHIDNLADPNSTLADDLLTFDADMNDVKLNDFFDDKEFVRDYAYTIRCGGRNSPITSRQVWDGYMIKKGNKLIEYRLSLKDALKLQGFEDNFELVGSTPNRWALIGNTIPTNLTSLVIGNIKKYILPVIYDA